MLCCAATSGSPSPSMSTSALRHRPRSMPTAPSRSRDGVKFTTNPSVADPVPGTSIGRVDVAAVSDVTGWIDTNSREMALQGDVVASLFGSGLENCPIGPATVPLATTNPDGRAFDPDTATRDAHDTGRLRVPRHRPRRVRMCGAGTLDQRRARLGHPRRDRVPDRRPVHDPGPATSAPPPPPSAAAEWLGDARRRRPRLRPRPRPRRRRPRNRCRPSSRRPPRPKAKTTAHASATGGTTSGPTTTTVAPHEFPTGDPHALLVVPPTDTDTPTTFGRTPIAAEFPVPDHGSDRTSLGIGVLVASLACRDRRLPAAPLGSTQAVAPQAPRRVLRLDGIDPSGESFTLS